MTASDATVKRLVGLQRLTLEALGTHSERELSFLIVNQSASVAPYDRAYLWDIRDGIALLGVSGEANVPSANAQCQQRRKALARRKDLNAAGIFPENWIDGTRSAEAGAFWLPIPVNGRPFAGLLLERLGSPAWSAEDADTLRVLGEIYSGAFKSYAGGKTGTVPRKRLFKRLLSMLALLGVAAALAFVRLPLRVVVPCEIVAANPIPVNAPVDGVIMDVLVRPGRQVNKGDILYTYNTAVAREEIDVAAREVEIARSNLERATAKAGSERSSRADARVLQNRLAQDIARLEALKERFEKYSVAAPADGAVITGEPHELAGRPVRVGEAVIMLADAKDTLLRIWLPQEDSMEFDKARPLKVFLHADSGGSRQASLTYVAAHATAGLDGLYGFMAEAEWVEGGAAGVRLGQKGTAILYGEKVRLAYWLARKPLTALRRFAGV